MQPSYGRRIVTQSFHEGEAKNYTVEIEDHIATTYNDLLPDIIKCLSLIKQHPTPKLTITVHMDQYNQPIRITRAFVERKGKASEL